MLQYIEYIPEVLQEQKEFIAIGSAVDMQLAMLQSQYDQMMKNRYIDTADAATLRRQQAILGLEYNPDMSLEEQRSQIKARKQVRFIINLQRIRTMLAEITGNDATLSMDYDALLMTVRVALPSKHNLRTVEELLADTVPANVVLNIYLLYNQHGFLKHFTHARLAELTHKQIRSDVLVFSTNQALNDKQHSLLANYTHLQLRKGDF